VYNVAMKNWEMVPGSYTFMAGPSSQTLPLKQVTGLP